MAWFDDFQLVRPVAAAGRAGAGGAGLGIGTTGPSLVVALAEDLRETAGLPALSIAVLEDGEITYAEAFGLASLDGQRPATVDTRFRAASVSKTITATAVAKLVQEERLDLDAPVTQYVPSWPEPPPITPRMLAGHLAGVAHYQGADRIERNRHYVSVAEALGVFRDSPRSGAPGEEYTYSTHGFTLLSAVVEGAAGRPFLEYLDAEIFGPLGMQGSGPDLRESPSPETAVLYGRRAGQPFALAAPEDPSYKWGAGGLLSTPSDLVRMARGYLTGFIAPDIVEEMWTSQTTADGEATGVGIGWRVGEDFAGRRIVHHAGAMGGARSVLVIYPEAETAVSLMTNTIWVSAIEQTAQLVLEAYLASAAECPSAFAGIASNEPYTGDFSDAEGPHQAEGTVSLDGCAGDIDTPQPLRDWMATAAVDRMPIHHLRENRWVLVMPYGLAPMELERTSDGKLTGRVQLTPTRVWEFVTE